MASIGQVEVGIVLDLKLEQRIREIIREEIDAALATIHDRITYRQEEDVARCSRSD